MIVDVHTHYLRIHEDLDPRGHDDMRRAGLDPDRWAMTPERHLKATDAADAAIVFGMQAHAAGWHVPNDVVAEHVRRAPHRLIFFASVDPAQDGFMAELERCHLALGARGVKLGPVYQGRHPHDPRCYEIYRYCARHGLPILMHMAATFWQCAPLEFARPIHIDRVANDFPDLRIILAHLGYPWEAETVAVVLKQPNVFADCSGIYHRPWQFYQTMRLVTEFGAHAKVLFGSDFPATTTASSIVGLRGVNLVLGQSSLPPVPSEVIEGIIQRDALALLGLDAPAPSTQPGRPV